MFTFFKRRQQRKMIQAVLRHTRHVRHWREDVLTADQLSILNTLEKETRDALTHRDLDAADGAGDRLGAHLSTLAPRRRLAWISENVEVILVAIAVAMGVRAYFIQPFKIPTGSMQSTLYGIHSETGYHPETNPNGYKPNWTDAIPFRYAKRVLLGEHYRVVRSTMPGRLIHVGRDEHFPSYTFYKVGGVSLRIPSDACDDKPYSREQLGTRYDLRFKEGDNVPLGAVVWEGREWHGDHVFVDKLSWNMRRPRRGEVSVFDTAGIGHGITPNTHYIKRMIGLPGERIQIKEPHILVNGKNVSQKGRLARIATTNTGRRGYHIDGQSGIFSALATSPGMLLNTYDNSMCVSNEYFVLGDNTVNSRDGRYWGTVPEKNLVGPAFLVYWPFSKRWGLIR